MIQNIIKTTSQQTKTTSLYEKIEHYLTIVFEKELKTEGSILVDYNPFVIKKIAGYLSGRIQMPASIGIAEKQRAGNLQLQRI